MADRQETESTAFFLCDGGRIDSKFPTMATLQAEYARLMKEKEALSGEYGKLKKQVKEYNLSSGTWIAFCRYRKRKRQKPGTRN